MIDTKRIKKEMLQLGISTYDMQRELRIPYYALIQILDKGYPPMWETLVGISRMIGCSATDLIVKEKDDEQGYNRT